MKFNVAKCHSMRVTRHPPDKHIQFEYTLHQQRLEQVQSTKYIGMTITGDFDWGKRILEISAKATKALVFLRRKSAFAPRHTKVVSYKTLVRPNLEYAAPIWHPYHKLRLDRWRMCRGQLPGGPAGDGETPVASTTCLTNFSDHLWRAAGSSLTHSGTVSLDKDKYLTPVPNLGKTRASQESQYTRYLAYSDVLKNSFFPRKFIPMWNGLSSSVFLSKTIEEFKVQI